MSSREPNISDQHLQLKYPTIGHEPIWAQHWFTICVHSNREYSIVNFMKIILFLLAMSLILLIMK